MKEYPILFNDEMVRAILDGTKTQTRRPMKDQPETYQGESGLQFELPGWYGSLGSEKFAEGFGPFGKAGDLLWGRECWQQTLPRRGEWERFCIRDPREGCGDLHYRANCEIDPPPKWRPSIHMPRWASRITLDVKRVWVERVQEISPADCLAELGTQHSDYDQANAHEYWREEAEATMLTRWDSIYAQTNGYGSAYNPLVWACEFDVNKE